MLICYDDSPSARRALAVAHETLGPRRIQLVHVYSAPQTVLADAFSTRGDDPGRGSVAQERLETLSAARAREVVDSGAALASELGFDVEAEIREAPADTRVWQAILEAADALDAALIVIGTRGATAVQDQPLGSVSEAVVRHSHRPVLIVPCGD